MQRREFIKGSVSAVTIAGVSAGAVAGKATQPEQPTVLKGRLKQSVCKWCYGMSVDDLCRNAAEIGLRSVELLGEKDWAIPAKYGLACAVANGPNPIHKGWNRVEHHDRFVAESERLLPMIAEAGIPNMIVFSGNRAGLDDEEGIANCALGLKRIMPLAERVGVTVIMELLNSKVDHKDYQCDHTAWGVKLVEAIGSDRFRLLYDIYHMQIMEGDVIRTITQNKDAIGHYHTGGVPGRREIDETQELYYPAICKAIVEMGYTGYLGQEFIPSRDPMTSLRQAAALCDV
jgi:hydroxypyruvate isomerase